MLVPHRRCPWHIRKTIKELRRNHAPTIESCPLDTIFATGNHALPWHARPGLPWRHWRGHSSPPLHGPLPHSKSQLHALRSARIHTISSQTRNRCSCGLLISQSLKPRGSGITGPGLGAHPFAKDKTAENTISMVYTRNASALSTHRRANALTSLLSHHTLPWPQSSQQHCTET